MFRTGNGIDFHRLIKGNGFLLGGVKIPSRFSIKAHSDGDILYHSLSDAILGALALGDIGKFFPDTSENTLNMNSEDIFLFSLEQLSKNGYKISNMDSTILLQTPKLRDYIDIIRQNISKVSGLNIEQISLKATTTEKMGFIGESKGIAVYSSVLIYKE